MIEFGLNSMFFRAYRLDLDCLRFVDFFMLSTKNQIHHYASSNNNFVKNVEPIKFAHR